MWCWCVWAEDCKGVGVYGLWMSAEVSVVSVCMGWDDEVSECGGCESGDECGGVLCCRFVWAGDEC